MGPTGTGLAASAGTPSAADYPSLELVSMKSGSPIAAPRLKSLLKWKPYPTSCRHPPGGADTFNQHENDDLMTPRFSRAAPA